MIQLTLLSHYLCPAQTEIVVNIIPELRNFFLQTLFFAGCGCLLLLLLLLIDLRRLLQLALNGLRLRASLLHDWPPECNGRGRRMVSSSSK